MVDDRDRRLLLRCVLVIIAALVLAILAFEVVRWNLRPAARRLRHMRRIDRELARGACR